MPIFGKKLFSTTPKSKETIQSLWKLEKIILDTLDFREVVQKICDSVLTELGYLNLGYRIIVLTLADEEKGILKRISLSQTPEAAKALAASAIPFHEIEIPLDTIDNLLIKTFIEKKPQVTHFWPDLFTPILTSEQALKNQTAAGIKTSMLFPVIVKDKSIGVLIFSMIKNEKDVSENEMDLIHGFTDVVGLAVQNARLYTSLEETKGKLEKANIRLQELDKLKDDFVSVASHELRTPMTAIKSYIWMALNKKKSELSPDLEKYLSRSYISVERLINLVNDMLNISRIEGGRIALRLSEVSMLDLTKEVIEEVAAKAQEKNIRLIVAEQKFPNVLCDRDKIHEVLLNLIGNSLKFTPQSGQISVNFSVDGPFLQTSVTDSGVGIAKENLPKLFSKFGRLENSYVAIAESGGTGLGLFITKSLIEYHKGSVKADSPGPGRGSTFSFTLPTVGSQMANLLAKEAPKETEETKDLEKTNINLI